MADGTHGSNQWNRCAFLTAWWEIDRMVSLSDCAERLYAAELLSDEEFKRIKNDLYKVMQIGLSIFVWYRLQRNPVCLNISREAAKMRL